MITVPNLLILGSAAETLERSNCSKVQVSLWNYVLFLWFAFLMGLRVELIGDQTSLVFFWACIFDYIFQ